jgi:hypothetical protein
MTKERRDGGLFGMIFNDPGNKKALMNYAGLTKKYEDKNYILMVDEPLSILITDYEDFTIMKRMFRKYNVKFNENEEIKVTDISKN